ncbi:hypothetical protein E3U26_06995 [Paracoccus ferrooxidans]|nr:hypothetical protein E3U26_06995 [Paracoccus ferrooxidans]
MIRHDHIDARACRTLWCAVFDAMLSDLNAPGHSAAADAARRQAQVWFARGPDMLTVAALAGLDGRLIRERYLAGQIGPRRAA